MKAYFLAIILISCIVYTYERKSIGKLTDLRAVTSFEGIENFYLILRQEKSESPPQESRQLEKNINIKKTLCKNIFTSNYFFDIHREDWIDVDVKENRVELKNVYPDLFKFIYKERKTLCLSFGGDSCYSYKYENSYKLLPISVDGFKGDEYLFMCLVRDRQLRKIKPYFVSQEYNVNAFRNNYPMAGRFIFGYNIHKNGTHYKQLKILALAEESAIGWDFLSRFIEMYYVSERSADKPRRLSNRRKNFPRPAEINVWENGVRNRSLSSDVDKSNIGSNRETTDDVMMMPSFNDEEMYADETIDRKNKADQQSFGNGKETLNNVNEIWKNNGKNTRDTMVPWAASDTDMAAIPKTFYDNEDPICQLTTSEKLRLCATIFASSVFKSRVKFIPTIDNVQLECERKQISLIAEVAEPPPLLARITQWEIRENGRESYEESVIGCRAKTRDKNYKMTFLVSQGNYDNSVFVYTHKFSDRRVFVYNYFNNTSVV